VSGGRNTPDVHTWTPGLMICPPMMIGPIVTQMGPTLGGTNVSSVDCGGGGWEAAGAVFALALATEVAKASTAVVAAAVNRLRIRILEDCHPCTVALTVLRDGWRWPQASV
jgi:hypothetical protein